MVVHGFTIQPGYLIMKSDWVYITILEVNFCIEVAAYILSENKGSINYAFIDRSFCALHQDFERLST